MKNKPLVSVIVPVYNEEKVIGGCLESLAKQTYQPLEVIVVDDGSDDRSVDEIKVVSSEIREREIRVLKQEHQGPGSARNLGTKKARGEILVFVDADMEFEPDFIEKLVTPIIAGKTIGTFSKEEYLLNKDNVWARCWNLNLGRSANRIHPDDYPDKQEVFRAILKKEFEKVGGFDINIGYTDDWSLSRKLGILATCVSGAKFYHRNPQTLLEVWRQARWFGKNEFLTKNFARKMYNLVRYYPLLAVVKGIDGAIKYREPQFLIFKIIYDAAVFTSVGLSFFGEHKEK